MSLTAILYICLGIFFFIGVSIAGGASQYFIDVVSKKEKEPSSVGLTADEFLVDVVRKKRLNIKLISTEGRFKDFYSSKHKVIALSEVCAGNNSIAALAIAAHEIGHAITDKENNATFKFHRALAKFVRLLNAVFYFVLIAALAVYLFVENSKAYYTVFLYIALGIVLLSILLKLVTLKNEKNASAIGLNLLKEYSITQKEVKAVKKIYSAALTTYAGAIFMPIAKFLQFLINIIYMTIGRLFR